MTSSTFRYQGIAYSSYEKGYFGETNRLSYIGVYLRQDIANARLVL